MTDPFVLAKPEFSLVEIERKFLLTGMPTLPLDVDVWRIEQGYLGFKKREDGLKGRIRRITKADGSVICVNTIKKGSGLVRKEFEQRIPERLFERAWPRTEGRRLRKLRYIVHDGSHVWEIDAFEDIDLHLAEVELRSADERHAVPAWLQPHILREVTDDPAFTNAQLAFRIGIGPDGDDVSELEDGE